MIVILHSDVSAADRLDDQETLDQARAVQQALIDLGYSVTLLPFHLDFRQMENKLRQLSTKLVFNLVESIDQKGDLCHLIPLWLEKLNIPYTGGNSFSQAVTSDKMLAKKMLQHADLPTPPYFSRSQLTKEHFAAGETYIIKAVREDGSLGIDQGSIVNNYEACAEVFKQKQLQYGGEWFAEKYIAGREYNVSLLPNGRNIEVLPIAEIEFINTENKYAIVDYAAKWQLNSAEYKGTPRRFRSINPALEKRIHEIAIEAMSLFQAASYARLDVRVDLKGEPWILELNINPSLALDAGFAAAAVEVGIQYNQLIKQIINYAFNKDSYA